MGVRQHVRRAVDVAVGDAVRVEPLDQRRRLQRRGPGGDAVVEPGLVVAARGVGGVARIACQSGLAHGLGETAEHAVLVGADQHHLALFRRVDVGRRDHRQDRAGALAHIAADIVFGDQAFHHREHRLVDRAVDHLAAAGALAVVDRHHCAERREGGGQRVADRDPGAARRGRRVADDIAQPAHRLADRAIARALRIGPGLAVARDPDHDDAGVDPGEAVIAEVPALHRAGAKILDQDVGLRGEAADDLLAVGLAGVHGDRFLVAREHREPELLAVRFLLPPFAHRIALAGLLQLDHLGAEIGQQLAAERPGDELAHLQNPQIVERSLAVSGIDRHGRPSCAGSIQAVRRSAGRTGSGGRSRSRPRRCRGRAPA